MKVLKSGLPECLIIEPAVFDDSRGFFYESWSGQRYSKLGLPERFVQSNVSRSSRGVLRGLHHQWPNPQGKLVSVLEGEIYDVAVDIRKDSAYFRRWSAVLLSGENKRQFWIPAGFAHGFVVLSDHAIVNYLCTEQYDKDADAGIRWNDSDIGIDWPVDTPLLSEKDANAPFLNELADESLPKY